MTRRLLDCTASELRTFQKDQLLESIAGAKAA